MVCKKCGYQNHKDASHCTNCHHRLKGGLSRNVVTIILIAAIVLTVAVLGAVVLKGLPKGPAKPTTPETTNQTEPVQARSWRDNILMRDRVDTVIPLGGFRSSIIMNSVFGSDLMRADIGRVVFEDSLKNAPSDSWDVSDAQDHSVLAWAVPAENNLYVLHIAAEGGINGKLACEDLFCGYGSVTSIEFNDCFHTEEAEDFSRMFYGCGMLKQLNLRGIKTDNARNLSEMFAGCHAITSLDVRGFDTEKVEDTSGMFSNCWNLSILDITGFNLFSVRDISYMFYQCPAAHGIQLNKVDFNFRNVDRYDNFMDEDVYIGNEPWIAFFEVPETTKPQTKPSLSVGDTVIFGSYEQDNRTSNGAEPVEWLVLDVEGDQALLLSRYALDSQSYHRAPVDVTWENSSLREWLNSDFLNTAFTSAEQKFILMTQVDNSKAQGNAIWQTESGNHTNDYVFLLSYSETEKYFHTHSARVCSPTSYAQMMGADTRELPGITTDAGWWWLRSPGEKRNHASFVNFDGTRYTNMVSNSYLCVRPAMWISLQGNDII